MSSVSPEHPDQSGAVLFPLSDHFPLGRAYGLVDDTAEPATEARPFGLSLAVRPSRVTRLDPAALAYDEDAQIGLLRGAGGELVPTTKHTDGQTNTLTDGDGSGNKGDSDTDWRED